MFINLAHKKLEVYQVSKKLAFLCYQTTKDFPIEEKFGLTQQIRRASSSILLNIAEGSSRKSPLERKRFFEIARGSAVEIDAALDLAVSLSLIQKEKLTETGERLVDCFKLLSNLISKS
ncbi:MAG: four helix bundle protein [Chitinophagaceae bacterium]|nr:four helix bundle protein [Chitinophagaceae bacterium]